MGFQVLKHNNTLPYVFVILSVIKAHIKNSFDDLLDHTSIPHFNTKYVILWLIIMKKPVEKTKGEILMYQ